MAGDVRTNSLSAGYLSNLKTFEFLQVSLKNRREAYSPEKRKEWTGPVEGPWLHGSIIHLLEKGEADADNIEMDSLLLCLPHLV